jgi:hypothetical protein
MSNDNDDRALLAAGYNRIKETGMVKPPRQTTAATGGLYFHDSTPFAHVPPRLLSRDARQTVSSVSHPLPKNKRFNNFRKEKKKGKKKPSCSLS